MEDVICSKAYKFGDNIDTDQIYPGRYLELTEAEDVADHAMEGVDPDFVSRFKPGGIIVAGENFGCGSSREHAAITLKHSGVSLIIAESAARIFYRNCINLGMPVMICKGISTETNEGDELEVNITEGKVKNLTQNKELQGEPLSDYVLKILSKGGIKPLLKEQYGDE